jgi:predicted RNA-binding Zn ribbon-like protein
LLVMSKTQEAPGELERVREFVNTLDLEAGTEALADPAALSTWLAERGLGPARATREDLRRALELREALRAVLLAHTNGLPVPAPASAALDHAARQARLRLGFDHDASPVLEPEASGVAGALGRLLAIVAGAIADGTWERLKACREHSCEWAFYDHTKNRSGAWCTMAVCGNRAKARAYRERRQ